MTDKPNEAKKPALASEDKPKADPQETAKADVVADDKVHDHRLDRLRRAIKPLEQAAANAHDQAVAGHDIAPTVTEAVSKAAHEMVLAAKAVLA